ncbi:MULTISPECIES: hypothetical protein [Micromonospora]|nr:MULTISPECIES: hypothetical protein [Micromonospora]
MTTPQPYDASEARPDNTPDHPFHDLDHEPADRPSHRTEGTR